MMCLLLGIGLTQLSAQIPPPSNGKETGTVSYLISNVYWQPIVCNGDVVDNLEGTATWHVVYKWERELLFGTGNTALRSTYIVQTPHMSNLN